ncbi:MAG TPA: AAA family ATPase, partial [Terriglobales bacterium]|nr:AAA family ATPase [Terriglobales bacterium]
MESEGSAERLRIDLVAECIWRDGRRVSVPPKAFLVLRQLMDRPQQVVTVNELLAAVWQQAHVSANVLNNAISQLRQALGDGTAQPRFIATVHRRGFRWIGPAAVYVTFQDEDACLFVGRDDTLAELQRCYAHATAGRRQIVFVTGEPGIGKSSVIERFLRTIEQDPVNPALTAYGECVDGYGKGEIYRPLLEAAESLVRAGGEAMRAVFRQHAPIWLQQMRTIVGHAELDQLHSAAQDSTLEWMQRELEGAIEAASAERTVVLALDDLHWSDAGTVSLIGALAARRSPARLMILATYRPYEAVAAQHPIVQLKHELAAKRQCVDLALDGVSSAAVDAYIGRRFAPNRFPLELSHRLHAQTSGNPLFLLNALAELEQRGWLYRREDTWECGAVAEIGQQIPDGTRALIAFRLEQLSPAVQELLEVASLVGMSFTTQTITAATERGASEVESDCRRLARTLFLQEEREVEWPDGSRGLQLRFRHSLYRQVLAERILPSRRQLLHRRIAARLVSGYGEDSPEITAKLSHHYEHAGDAFRAVDFIEMLVKQTFASRAMHDTMVLYERAIGLLERQPASENRQRRLLQLNIALGLFSNTTVGGHHATSERAIEEVR